MAPVLQLRCTGQGQWGGQCPVCEGERKLSFAVGTAGRRFVWSCHRKPGCPPAAILNAMITAGVREECIASSGRHRGAPGITRADLESLTDPLPASVLRLRAAMLLWDCGARDAAAKLGMPERTYYRAVTTLPKMAERRRSR